MKRAYLANGTLTSYLLRDNNTCEVDSVLFDYISNLLAGEYCYLVINGEEIVKVLGVSGTGSLLIQRGDARRAVYLAGTQIKYDLTPNEIQDAVETQSLTLTQSNAIVVDGNKISYPQVSINSVGGVKVSDLPDVMVQDIDSAQCCTDTIPQQIPISYLPLRIVDSGYRINDDGSYRIYG